MFYCKTLVLSLSTETIKTASEIAASGGAAGDRSGHTTAESATTPAE